MIVVLESLAHGNLRLIVILFIPLIVLPFAHFLVDGADTLEKLLWMRNVQTLEYLTIHDIYESTFFL
jgi:hypothetical protein